MITLSKAQIITLHDKLIEATGGLGGISDEGLLDSALSSAFHTFDDEELFPSVVAKIARITYSLVCNHPFLDGNKRIGMYVMLVLLDLNQIAVSFSDDDIIRIGLSLASGKMTWEQLIREIIDHS
jgi:death-on-curing protein